MELKAELLNATQTEKNEFISEYNHNCGYEIKQEKVIIEHEIEVPTTKEEEIIDDDGNVTVIVVPVLDEHGNPVYHTEIVEETRWNLQAWGETPEEQAHDREESFKNTFFEIPSFGWFRKRPKGYSSAVESLNTAFNAVSIMGSLPANMLIFYTAPDFTKPEECTEDWLIEHQTFNETMTAQEFGQFYVAFMTAWNNQEHVNEVENDLSE